MEVTPPPFAQGRIGLAVPGAIALAGWDPLPYGQCGKGPKHPTLSAIIAIPIERFDVWMDRRLVLLRDWRSAVPRTTSSAASYGPCSTPRS